MSAIKPEDLEYMENVYALVLAILYPKPLSPEQAFKKLLHPDERVRVPGGDVVLLREAGCRWAEIRELTGCKWPQNAYKYHIQQKRKRENNVTSEKTEKTDCGKGEGLREQGAEGQHSHGCQRPDHSGEDAQCH